MAPLAVFLILCVKPRVRARHHNAFLEFRVLGRYRHPWSEAGDYLRESDTLPGPVIAATPLTHFLAILVFGYLDLDARNLPSN